MWSRAAVLALVALSWPVAGWSQANPRYTYVEAGYVDADFDDRDVDGDGLGVGGSYAFNEWVHFVAGYQDLDLGRSADYSAWTAGVGAHLRMRDGLDLVGRVRYIDSEIDTRLGDDEEDGYGLEGQLRLMINPQLEFNGGVDYVDLDDSETAFTMGAVYEVVPNIAVTGQLALSDDVTSFFVGARLYFSAFR